MAISSTMLVEFALGNKRAKIFTLTHDNSSTTATIVPGAGFTKPIGSDIKSYATSGSTGFTLTFNAAGTSGSYTNVMFISG